MSGFDVLEKWGHDIKELRAVLTALRDEYPQVAGRLDPIIAALDVPLSVAKLSELAAILPLEAARIVAGDLDPRPHPGDAV